MALADSTSVQTNVFHPVTATDTVAISDGPALDRTAKDTLAIVDKNRLDSTSNDAVSLSDSTSGQSAAFHPVDASDQLALSDKGQPDSSSRDAIPLSDSTELQSAVFHPLAASDTVVLKDFTSLPATVAEILQLGDAASLPSRLVTSVLDIVDTVLPVPGKGFLLDESLAVDAQMLVSVYWDRLFAEAMDLADCTPSSCNQGLHFGDGLSVGDEFIPPPKHFETISATDTVARTAFFQRSGAEPLAVSDRISAAVTMAPPPTPPGSLAPPLSATIVSDKNIVAPVPGADLTGTYTLQDANQLVSQLNLPAMTITNNVAPSDLPSMTVVLPIYHVNLVPSPRLPGDDAMLTVKVAQIPAETPIMVPINIAATPQTADQEIPWMKIEYTPKVDSTNSALMVSMMDSPPAGAQPVNANFTPLFLDVKWAGNFPAATPDTGDYYRSLPTLTFAITEAWASQQNVLRDENNVPVMSLNLYDDATGAWTEVSNIDRPAAIDGGQYVYVAHLDHFSTYVISASKAARGSGSGPQPPSIPTTFAAQLADSITAADAPASKAVEFVEEFSKNKNVLVAL